MELPAFRELPAEPRAAQREQVVECAAALSRRRPSVLAVALGLAVLLAAPALALRQELVDFWSGEPAPGRVQLQFDRMSRAFTGSGGKVVPQNAREVMAITLGGERMPLWVAPTDSGSFCWSWNHVAACNPGSLQFGLVYLETEGGGGLDWLAGAVTARDTARVEVRYEDGARAEMPFVWVSPPIDAGFVLFDVPVEHEREGRRPATLVALDADGRELAKQAVRYAPPASDTP